MTDIIRKQVVLKAPRAKVWRAISDSKAFGTWFGMTVDGPFVAGKTTTGKITMTAVDPAVAKQQEPHVGMACDLMIERVEPETLFSFRWHPGAEEAAPGAPTTLVTFELADAAGGTQLTITESGFDALPLEKRAKAFADNDGGWEAQLGLIAKYLDAA
jgi:uncharacterized protein YndB with AHSA1/START domain